jgi:23S rRNA pseudouridine2605 synthase
VQRLVRTAIGPVRLGGLRAGALRELTREELAALYRAADPATADAAGDLEG